MLDDNSSRGALLRMLATTIGSAWLTLEWSAVLSAANDAHVAARDSTAYTKVLTDEEAADIAAITAQIIPSDAPPGAREAGIAEFIDRALATFFERLAPSFREQLAEFRAECSARHPLAASFAALPTKQQIGLLHSIEHAPFLNSVRLLTLIGMFAMPEHRDNRRDIGWLLLSLEVQHTFVPPFGEREGEGERDEPQFRRA